MPVCMFPSASSPPVESSLGNTKLCTSVERPEPTTPWYALPRLMPRSRPTLESNLVDRFEEVCVLAGSVASNGVHVRAGGTITGRVNRAIRANLDLLPLETSAPVRWRRNHRLWRRSRRQARQQCQRQQDTQRVPHSARDVNERGGQTRTTGPGVRIPTTTCDSSCKQRDFDVKSGINWCSGRSDFLPGRTSTSKQAEGQARSTCRI